MESVPYFLIAGQAASVALSFDNSRHWRPRWRRFSSRLCAPSAALTAGLGELLA
jgi:hypothetical protein